MAERPSMFTDETKQVVLASATLVGLTPLIPIPILDDIVKDHIKKRLIVEIGRRHGMVLDDETVKHLLHEDGSVVRDVAAGIVTFPFRLVFRKLFVVLEVKRASDEASRAFHFGYLLDRALAKKAMVPEGPRTPSEIREAIEAATAESGISPMAGAVRAVFQGSRDLLSAAVKRLAKELKPHHGEQVKTGDVARAVKEAEKEAVEPLTARVARAVDALPEDYFRGIEERFDQALATGALVGRR